MIRAIHNTPAKDVLYRKKPISVSLLLCLGFSIVGINLLQVIYTLKSWSFLVELKPGLPYYHLTSASLWVIVGTYVMLKFWKSKPGSSRLYRLVGLCYSLFFWLDGLILANPVNRITNWPVLLITNCLILILIFWTLWRPNIKAYFGE